MRGAGTKSLLLLFVSNGSVAACIARERSSVYPMKQSTESLFFLVFLLHLQVTTIDGTVIHVTGTHTGFYVNGTRKENFDPTPAANNPCHSHELITCLLHASPSFAKVRLVVHCTHQPLSAARRRS